jgi:predicted CDP-diglyceride synthetase/phosphatidate cytidylyltransferase
VALREYFTLAPTRRGDHWALVMSFFVVLPFQYFLIWIEWYSLFTIMIPVHAFLLLPLLEATGGDTRGFMQRTATVQWGLMITVYCISHVPALLTLDIPGYAGRNAFLIVFLVIVVPVERRAAVRLGKARGQAARSRPTCRPRRPSRASWAAWRAPRSSARRSGGSRRSTRGRRRSWRWWSTSWASWAGS